MTRTRLYPLFAALIAVLFSGICSGQVRPATGLPPFGSFGGGPFDTLNLGNLNAHFAIPVLHKAGRGMAFSYDLSYDSSVWSAVSSSGSTTWVPIGYWGWTAQTQAAVGYLEAPTYNVPQTCNIPGGGTTNWSYSALDHAIYHDKFGVSHYFYFSPNLTQGQEPSICTLIGGQQWNQNPSGTATATDGSRMSLALTIFASSGGITTRDGETIAAPINVSSGLGTDLNGNQITVNTSGQFLDTLSSTTPALTVAGNGTPASPITMTYAGPSGSVAYKMNYTSYTVKTNFGLTGISEYGPISNSLVSSIMLPDNSSYFFTYEVTPGTCTPLAGTYSANCITGRIASVTLPTGGTITYGYTGGPGSTGIESDGSTAGLTRTLNPGGQWTYARSYTSTGTIWTTTVTDPTPAHNQTVINFQEDSGGFATGNFYETQRVAYVGTAPTTPLLTQIICYDSVNSIPTASNCPTIPVTSPIAGKWIFRYPLGAGTPALTFSYHSLDGFTSSVKEWDFGVPTASNWVRSSVTTYGGQMRCPEQIQVFANPLRLLRRRH